MRTFLENHGRPLHQTPLQRHCLPTEVTTPLGCTWSHISSAILEVDRRLEQASAADAAGIVSLFERLTLRNPGGHTIFGRKPLTTIALERESTAHRSSSIVTRDEWTAWTSSIERLGFVSARLVLRESNAGDALGKNPELLVYNRDTISAAYQKHQAIFARRLGPDFSLTHLFHSLDTTRGMESLCGGDAELKGILLGYGQRSSRIYAKVQELGKKLGMTTPGNMTELQSIILRGESGRAKEKKELLGLLSKLSYSATAENCDGAQNMVGCRLASDDKEGAELQAHYRTNIAFMRELHELKLLPKVALARWINLV